MKRVIGLGLILCLLLCGCGGKDYSLTYESRFVNIGNWPEAAAYFAERAVNEPSEEHPPMLLLASKGEYEVFLEDLTAAASPEAAAKFSAWFRETEATFFAEDVFAEWSVAVVCCQEPETVRHMVWLKTDDDAFRIDITKISVKGDGQKQTVWLIPVWVTKAVLERSTVIDAAVMQEISQRYPLLVETDAGSRGCLTEGLSELECDVNTMGLASVRIDLAGDVQKLENALKQGSITIDELLLRAQIDAESGLCRRDDYNDGGTVVYTYETYKLYRLKQLSASGEIVAGDIWITTPDVELNAIK